MPQHFGVRTQRHKLIYFPKTDEWNLFDLQTDPDEMKSVAEAPEYADVRQSLVSEFERLRAEFQAPPYDRR